MILLPRPLLPGAPAPAGAALAVTIPDGVRVCVPPWITGISTYVLVEQEDWFEDEIRFVRRLLRPGDHAVDVGANCGVYALSMARAVGPAGRIWAFEPGPAIDHLRHGRTLNGFAQLTVIQEAMAERAGTVRLAVGRDSELAHLVEGTDGIAVHATTLDAAAADHGWDGVRLIKIDAEGAEGAILAGGERWLASVRPIVLMEVTGQDKTVRRGPVGMLERMGYRVLRLMPGAGVLVPADLADLDPFTVNVFACHPDRLAELEAAGLAATVPREPEIPADAWAAACAAMPGWATAASAGPVRLDDPGRLARDAVGHALAAGTETADRVGCVRVAAEAARRALAARESDPCRLTAVRTAIAEGRRKQAIELLEPMLARLFAGRAPTLDEPFLPPWPRFDRIDGQGRLAPWAAAAMIEAYERLRGHSGLYTPVQVEVMERYRRCGFEGAEMMRRRHLAMLRRGGRAWPADPALAVAGPDNLNPQFWRAAGAGRAPSSAGGR